MILAILLNICHFFGDFTPLSTPWMLEAKKTGRPLIPILAHALIHAILHFFIVIFWTMDFNIAICVFTIQLLTHWVIDILKGRMNVWCSISLVNDPIKFWALFGVDQLLHQSIIILEVWFVLSQ